MFGFFKTKKYPPTLGTYKPDYEVQTENKLVVAPVRPTTTKGRMAAAKALSKKIDPTTGKPYTQVAIAMMIGVSGAQVSNYLKGRTQSEARLNGSGR